jgi:hypothetical protein
MKIYTESRAIMRIDIVRASFAVSLIRFPGRRSLAESLDLDKCIPYFAEAASCGICIADCPWTSPAVRPKLLATMARRPGQK